MVFCETMAIDKNTIMKEAQKFVAKGQYDKAIAEWKKLLKETPDDPNIYNTIGDLCLKKESKPGAVDAYMRAADMLATDGFTSKAIALYKKILNIDPKKIEVHLALGDMNAAKGLAGNALESYKIVADHHKQQNKMVEALGIYQKMADLNPANVAFRIKLADMYAKEHLAAEAARAYLDAADAHMAKSAFTDARQLFEKVLSIDPNNNAVYHKAGVVYFKEGKFAEACKALKRAYETDPKNVELTDLYLDALSKAGREDDAVEIYQKLLAQHPSRIDLREKLFHIYRSKRMLDKALDEARRIAEEWIKCLRTESAEQGLKLLTGSGIPGEDRESIAEKTLKILINENPGFVEAQRVLSDFYEKTGRIQDAARELVEIARLLIPTGDRDGGKDALNRALELRPGLEEARDLLESLTTQAMPPPPEPATEAFGAPVGAPPSAPPPAAEAPEDPAIHEALTEIDVLVKYGLPTKAAEQLEAVAKKFPESARIRFKLRDIYGDLGQMNKAAAHMVVLADIYAGRGMRDQSEQVLRSALELDPTNVAVKSKLGMTPPPATKERPFEAPQAAVPPLEEIAPAEVLLPEIVPEHLDIPLTAPEISPPSREEAGAPHEPALTGEIEFEGLDSGIPPLVEAPYVPEPSATEQPSVEEELAGELEQAAIASPAKVDIGEIWAEAEFYFQQGLFDEARKHYAQIIALTPGDRRAIDRLSEISREEDETREFTKLADAVEGLEGFVYSETPEGELTTSASDDEAIRALMREIQQLKPQPTVPPPPPAKKTIVAPPRKPAPPKVAVEMADGPSRPAKKGEEDFLDLGEELQREAAFAVVPEERKASEDFFDLAAELKDELSGIPVPARPAVPVEEQSLDDIFEEFKKGVERQSVKEDADTHYNLGVAYKEMGLLDDAIGEFIMTPEDESKFVQSRYMLGLCYMEKGEYQNAIGEIQNALDYSETLGIDTRNRIEMRYDLGLACQGAGNISSAIGEFQKVVDEDPGYRDTAAKLRELHKGDFISPDQLKDDIEREISSKFLEEGVRIDREEKTRQNERAGT